MAFLNIVVTVNNRKTMESKQWNPMDFHGNIKEFRMVLAMVVVIVRGCYSMIDVMMMAICLFSLVVT